MLLARSQQSNTGVIFRRGPSAWVQMIHWDTKNDVFTSGQWLRGKIHAHKCDLSPNGKLLIYLASKSGNSYRNPDYGNAWTAISKPPYFTALGLWTYYRNTDIGGGGYFRRNDEVWVNHLDDNTTPHPKHQPKHITVRYPNEYTYERELYNHLLRLNQWKPVVLRDPAKHQRPTEWIKGKYYPKISAKYIWNKTRDRFTLVQKIYPERDAWWKYPYGYFEVREYEYAVSIDESDEEIKLDGTTWADFDHRGRLVIAKDGTLFTAATTTQGEISFTELADFNANKPEQVKTPSWARQW